MVFWGKYTVTPLGKLRNIITEDVLELLDLEWLFYYLLHPTRSPVRNEEVSVLMLLSCPRYPPTLPPQAHFLSSCTCSWIYSLALWCAWCPELLLPGHFTHDPKFPESLRELNLKTARPAVNFTPSLLSWGSGPCCLIPLHYCKATQITDTVPFSCLSRTPRGASDFGWNNPLNSRVWV